MTTTLTPKEIVRQACLKANPEIVELRFGCKTRDSKGIVILSNIGQPFKKCLGDNNLYERVNEKGNTCVIEIVETIGRDIRLADVLVALKAEDLGVYVREDGSFYGDTDKPMDIHFIGGYWNLLKDSLDDQSPETIEFLANLLK